MNLSEDIKVIARNVRAFREKQGMTREEWCERMGGSPEYWGYIERGERQITLRKLLEICHEFNMDVGSFIQVAVRDDTAELMQTLNRRMSTLSQKQLKAIDSIIDFIQCFVK